VVVVAFTENVAVVCAYNAQQSPHSIAMQTKAGGREAF
jgi:hypothetical protein